MARVVGIGLQDFSKIQKEKVFYIDKSIEMLPCHLVCA